MAILHPKPRKHTLMTKAPVALITAGSQRIGKAITQALHDKGFNVVIHYRSQKEAALALCQMLNDKRQSSATVIYGNLSNSPSCKTLITKAYQWQNQLDALINNASVFIKTPSDFANLDENWQTQFESNAKVPFLLAMAACPYLKKTKGNIINIADIHGNSPLKDYGIYCMTKAALLMQTKVLAMQLGPEIRVNAVSPGAIAWPEGDNLLTDSIKTKITNKTCLKRHGHPKNIAKAICQIIENDYLTGINLPVDGGRSV